MTVVKALSGRVIWGSGVSVSLPPSTVTMTYGSTHPVGWSSVLTVKGRHLDSIGEMVACPSS
jgi:hypothetical protein